MHHTILLPVALDHGSEVPRKLTAAREMLAPGGKIILLTVLERIPGFAAEMVSVKTENHLSAKVQKNLEDLAAGAADVEVQVTTGRPGMRISEVAADVKADLILVAAHHPSAMDLFLGSTAARVSRRAPCSVYIMR